MNARSKFLSWCVVVTGGFTFVSLTPASAITITEAVALTRTRLKEAKDEVAQLKVLLSHSNSHSDVVPFVCNGRLTLQSGVAVPGSNQTGMSTVYFTPYQGGNITLYNGTIWQTFAYTQISLTLAGLTTGDNYDVYIYNNAGTVTMALSAAWTNNTTRAAAQALTLTNGVYLLTSNLNYLYVGTIRTTAATTTEDSTANRFVWNYFNRRRRVMVETEAATNWTYNTATWRAADADNTQRLQYVVGFNEPLVEAIVLVPTAGTASANFAFSVGIGVDSTTANSAQVATAFGSDTVGTGTSATEYRGYPGIGYHYLQWIEYGSAAGVPQFFANQYNFKAGIFGYLDN
jgi:hypothetical protein